MEQCLVICCIYGSECAFFNVYRDTVFNELRDFVCLRWKKIDRERMSMTYGVPGYNTDMLDGDEGLRNMVALMLTMKMQQINVSIRMELELVISSSHVSASQLDDETDLLSNFCSHKEVSLMGVVGLARFVRCDSALKGVSKSFG